MSRTAEQFITAADGLDVRVEIATVGCTLHLGEVYDRVIFPDPGEIPHPA
jgi:hypothetical protein